MFVQRSGYADDERVHARNLRIVGSSGETMRSRGLDLSGKDAIDVRPAGLKNVHLLLVDIEAGHRKRLLAEEQSQRQADIAHSDDPDLAVRDWILRFRGSCELTLRLCDMRTYTLMKFGFQVLDYEDTIRDWGCKASSSSGSIGCVHKSVARNRIAVVSGNVPSLKGLD